MLCLVVGLFGFFICITSTDEKRLSRAVSCLLMISLFFHFRTSFTCNCAGTSRLILVKLP